MIKKEIHYCWFGKNEMPSSAIKCIESWKKSCPDYTIVEWNEDNYDVNKNQYTKYMYENKKYAFLTDYARLDVVYNNGGFYFDTDVEIIKNLDELTNNNCFMALEEKGRVNTGLGFGAEKNFDFLKENMNYYENIVEITDEFNIETCVDITSRLLLNRGLKINDEIQEIDNIRIYPVEYFCPKNYVTGLINLTNATYSIHHYDASWQTEEMRKISTYEKNIYKIFGNKVGKIISSIVLIPYKLLYHLKTDGIQKTFEKIKNRLKI